MAKEPTEKAFNADLCARVRQLREERGWTQEQMAEALGVPVSRYIKYEGRSPIRIYLLPKLALLTDTPVEWIVTGKGQRKPRLIQGVRTAV